ncbi:hypothetical protein bas69_0084 [Escherichia phage AlfredRasser]|nr:hypothetical protein bas69_0084 [Escherichia phage AlfredRasser]
MISHCPPRSWWRETGNCLNNHSSYIHPSPRHLCYLPLGDE